jgi:hypothetical protein
MLIKYFFYFSDNYSKNNSKINKIILILIKKWEMIVQLVQYVKILKFRWIILQHKIKIINRIIKNQRIIIKI